MSHEEIRPFKVEIPQSEHDRLIRKLRDTRIPSTEIVPDAGDDYGISTAWIRQMYDYWLSKYDWYKARSEINAYPHFTTSINNQTIHFVHAKSTRSDAIPILLIHGWPGSFYEFSQVVPLLTSPSNTDDQAFHCVVPSLPGFCYSSPPPRGQTLKHVAGMFHTLMHRLGYSRFAIQAGDWGHWCAREICANPSYSPSVLAAHFNWIPAPLPPLPEMRPGTCLSNIPPREISIRMRVNAWLQSHLAYAQFMRTRPSTLGIMLSDSPTALLAFIGEKYIEVSNPANPLVQSDTWKDHILTTVSLYYHSQCAPTASLIYFENLRHESFPTEILTPQNWIPVPMAYTSFLYDTRPSVKWGVEKTGNLVYYNERDNAGHFACLEEPQGTVDDLRVLVKMVVQGKAANKEYPGAPDLSTR